MTLEMMADKLVSKPITNFKSESQVYSAKELFFPLLRANGKECARFSRIAASHSSKRRQAVWIHNRFSIAQKDTPKRINLDNAYIYSTTDPDDHATLYKVQYKNPIESCPRKCTKKYDSISLADHISIQSIPGRKIMFNMSNAFQM